MIIPSTGFWKGYSEMKTAPAYLDKEDLKADKDRIIDRPTSPSVYPVALAAAARRRIIDRPLDPSANLITIRKLTPKETKSRSEAQSYFDKLGSSQDAYYIDIEDEYMSKVFESMAPFLERSLSEKTMAMRRRRMSGLIEVMAEQLVMPSEVDIQMAQRLAERRASLLNEFGYFTAMQLADANHSTSENRCALVDNWRKRRQVFSIQHPDRLLRDRNVYPAFQFSDYRPIKAVRGVLDAFGGKKDSWKLALWFTSSNGWLPDSARPADLLFSYPEIVVEAAQRDAAGSTV